MATLARTIALELMTKVRVDLNLPFFSIPDMKIEDFNADAETNTPSKVSQRLARDSILASVLSRLVQHRGRHLIRLGGLLTAPFLL